MGLDLLDQGQVRLGGLGARGLGLVEVHIDSVSVRDAKSLLQRTPQAPGSSSGRPQEALRDWLAALQQRVNGGRR
jgi:CRISPR/Cas system CSM-associated protein Csm3 (group 7 of RAMP superfamily)